MRSPTGCVPNHVSNPAPSTVNGLPVTEISPAAFADTNSSSVTIPDSVTKIGDFAFVRSSLTKATIGSNVVSIGDSAFAFTQLTAVSFLGDKPIIADDTFLNDRSLSYISYCEDRAGWPGKPISTGNGSVIPAEGCDAVNRDSESLLEIISAVQTRDALSITFGYSPGIWECWGT